MMDVHWWWLSFVGEEGFRGVCIVEANDMKMAVIASRLLGCNPGGEVQIIGIPPNWEARLLSCFPPNKLLTAEELKNGGALRVGDIVEKAQNN